MVEEGRKYISFIQVLSYIVYIDLKVKKINSAFILFYFFNKTFKISLNAIDNDQKF